MFAQGSKAARSRRMAERFCCVRRQGLDLAKVLAGWIRDGRDPTKVIHSYASMIDARIRVSFSTATPNVAVINTMLGNLVAKAP